MMFGLNLARIVHTRHIAYIAEAGSLPCRFTNRTPFLASK